MSEGMNASNPLRQGLILGIPCCGRNVAVEWALALATLRYPTGLITQFATTRGMEVGDARNEIVDQALKVDAKYILFLDDDTAPPPYAVQNLIYTLEQQSPPRGKAMVIGGIYSTKSIPSEPIVYQDRGHSGPYWNWKFGDIFECESIGTGCLLINVDIFRILPRPWFKTMNEAIPTKFSTLEFGKEKIHENVQLTLTDDIYFCQNVRDAGYTILAHGGVLCTHWDVTTQIGYHLADDSYPMIPREEKVETKPWNAFAVCEPKKSEVL